MEERIILLGFCLRHFRVSVLLCMAGEMGAGMFALKTTPGYCDVPGLSTNSCALVQPDQTLLMLNQNLPTLYPVFSIQTKLKPLSVSACLREEG